MVGLQQLPSFCIHILTTLKLEFQERLLHIHFGPENM